MSGEILKTNIDHKKPIIAVSACLLGESVRYDGGHKKNTYILDHLKNVVKLITVCPEVEFGMGIPREPIRLVDQSGDIKLLGQSSSIDHTRKMEKWSKSRLLKKDLKHIDGYIFKSKSPSCGLQKVKVYTEKGVRLNGTGVFASQFKSIYPHVPYEDEGRLNSPQLREHFIVKVFSHFRWNQHLQKKKTIHGLMEFHARHKYLLMSHCPTTLKKLGQHLAESKGKDISTIYTQYHLLLQEAFSRKATVRKHVNVLLHMMGYFKKNISTIEKKELVRKIDQYHKGLVPLIVPLTLINHHVLVHEPEYLSQQVYLNPHPAELMLRNHV